jgi:hypothetical protein
VPTKIKTVYQTGIRVAKSFDTRSSSNFSSSQLFSRDISGFTTGVSLPTWKQLVKRRINATTSMNYAFRNLQEDLSAGFNSQLYTLDEGGNRKKWAEFQYTMTGPWFGRAPVTASFPADSTADVTARLSLLGKIRDAQTQFNAGTFAGEIFETIRMLKRPASTLRQGIDSYVSAARKAAKRVKSVPTKNAVLRDTWLEYQYGWRPLIGDVDKAQQALSEAAAKITRLILTSGGKSEQNSTGSINLTQNSIPIVGIFSTNRSVSVRYKVAVSIWGDGNNVGSARWGLDGSNFFPNIYNLIPYSFLVDYFSNLGKVIDTACLQHFVIDWGCKTLRRRAAETCQSLKLQPGVIFSTPAERSRDTGTSMQSYTNEVVEGYRSSVMHVETGIADLRVQFPWSGTKWLNIAALASSRFLK